MIRTKHFNPETDPKLLCTCGHPYCDQRSVSQSTLDRAETLRRYLQRPVIVTSGGRCPYHPNEVHRVTPADHQKGNALDVTVSGGFERAEIVKLGMQLGFNAIGVAKTFVHLGVRHGQPTVMWVY